MLLLVTIFYFTSPVLSKDMKIFWTSFLITTNHLPEAFLARLLEGKCPLLWAATMAALMPELHDVSREWEQNEEIRANLRKPKNLLFKEAWEDEVKVNIAHASQNYEVLKPLVRRLVDSSGSVGQHAVGKIRSQFLVLHECRFNFATC